MSFRPVIRNKSLGWKCEQACWSAAWPDAVGTTTVTSTSAAMPNACRITERIDPSIWMVACERMHGDAYWRVTSISPVIRMDVLYPLELSAPSGLRGGSSGVW